MPNTQNIFQGEDKEVYEQLDKHFKGQFSKYYNIFVDNNIIGVDVFFVNFLSNLTEENINKYSQINGIGKKGLNNLINEVKTKYNNILKEKELEEKEEIEKLKIVNFLQKRYSDLSIEDIILYFEENDINIFEFNKNYARKVNKNKKIKFLKEEGILNYFDEIFDTNYINII